MQIVEMTLPAFWASALINGDYSGLEPQDIEALDNFSADMVRDHGLFSPLTCSEEEFFTWHHDARPDVLACTCLEYSFDVSGRTKAPQRPTRRARAIAQGRALYRLDPALWWLALAIVAVSTIGALPWT